MTPEEIMNLVQDLEGFELNRNPCRGDIEEANGRLVDAASALRFLLKEREQLREASQRVLDGLDARIDNAPGDAVPVFDGIAELHSALASPQRQGDRPELPNDLRSRETKTGENP